MARACAVLIVALLLGTLGCGATADQAQHAGDKGKRSSREGKVGPELEVAAPTVKECGDFYGRRDAFLYFDKHPEAAETLDPDGNDIPCDAPWQAFKDTSITTAEGNTYEVAFFTERPIKGILAGAVTVDVPPASIGYDGFVDIGLDVVSDYGPNGTEKQFRILWITYRNAKTIKEVDYAVKIADQQVREAWNASRMNALHITPEGVDGLHLFGFGPLEKRRNDVVSCKDGAYRNRPSLFGIR
jgi:hypothetical protein